MEKFKNANEEWRKEKAEQLKSIPDHKDRRPIWDKYKQETNFFDKFIPPEESGEYDTLKSKNNRLIKVTRFLIKEFQEVSFPFETSEKNDAFMENMAYVASYPYSRSGLSEIEEKISGITFAYWLKRMSDTLTDTDENVDLQKILLFDTHNMSKNRSYLGRDMVSDKFKKIIERYNKHYDFLVNNVFNEENKELQTKLYLQKVRELVSDLSKEELLQIDVNDELLDLKKMLENIHDTISKDISKAVE